MLPRLLALLFGLLCCLPISAAERRPNIVIILADDQAFGDLPMNGNTMLQTPHLAQLAREGVTLEHFYVCPVCSPTRAEFLTGRYHTRCGVTDVTSGRERLNLDEKTIADTFRAAGYATGAFGKWHNGSQWPYHPNARGFQEFYGFTSGHWGEYFDPPLEHNGQLVRGHGYIADDLTEHALTFIQQHQHEPFFCYLPFNTPHSPFCVPDEYWNRHRDQPIPQRGELGEKEDLASTRCVLAMNENLDWNVGRVLQRLEELHLAENTIVLYFSDNGPATKRWNAGLKGIKGSVDEGGVRVPCYLRWPGHFVTGKSVPQLAAALDLLPTLAHLAGVPLASTKPLDGRDLSTYLLPGPQEKTTARTLVHEFRGRTSIRSDFYRLDQAGQLFDLRADPTQHTAAAADQEPLRAELQHELAAWKQDTGWKAPPSNRSSSDPEDARPFPVGYREFPSTPLPARDGVPHGQVTRSAKAPNCSYFVNWKSLADTITWDVEVHTAGDYAVQLYYTCPEADAGSRVELSFLGAKVSGLVTPAWDPPLITGQDRAARTGESIMKPFTSLYLGVVHLPAGRGPLTLQAIEIPGQSVMDLRLLSLTLLPER